MNALTAIILAAGVGQRLGDMASRKPKCLLQFGGHSLLHRHLHALDHYGIYEVIVVTGYEAAQVRAELADAKTTLPIATVNNPQFEKGSVISLLTGLDTLDGKDDILLMDADVLYEHRIIGRLVHTAAVNCFLLDRNFVTGDEPVKLCVRDGQLIDFRKQIDKDVRFDFQGESVGFFRFTHDTANRLAERARDYITRGKDNEPYEECIRDLLLEKPDDFGFEDITGLPWVEIDFPEDVRRAENEILPLLSSTES